MTTTTSLITFAPLAACLLTLLLSWAGLRRGGRVPAVLGCFATIAASITLVLQAMDSSEPLTVGASPWLSIPGSLPLRVTLSFVVDRWAVWVTAAVTILGGIAVLDSAANRSREKRVERLLAPMLLSISATAAVVLAGDFLQMALSWGILSLATYWLIGHDSTELKTRNAVRKAVIVLQIGLCGLLLATFLIWASCGTLVIADVVAAVAQPTPEQMAVLPVIAVGLLIAAVAMCAQFPLFVWLPDAANGPAPATALIQSVGPGVAGIHLLVRGQPLLEAVPGFLFLIAVVGGVTALAAGYISLTQSKLPRLLAFSTMGHFGLMFVAVGTGTRAGIVAAGFHLVMHACGKSLLCLSGIDSSGGSRINKTLFAAGAAGTIGLPGISCFWSLAAILTAVRNSSIGVETSISGVGWDVLFWVSVAAIFLGAFSLVRISYFIESSGMPISIGQQIGRLLIAGASMGLGVTVGWPTGWLSRWFTTDFSASTTGFQNQWFVPTVCAAASCTGALIAWGARAADLSLPNRMARLLGPLTSFSRRELYLDALFFLGLTLPLRAISLLCRFADWFLIDRIWVGIARSLPIKLAKTSRPLQNGLAQSYALIMMLAVGLLLMIALWAGGAGDW